MADSSYRPRPQSSSGPRRRATPPLPIKLTSSASSSCIPLLAGRPSGSSPPAVTSAVAFGSTSTTPSPGAFSIGLAGGIQRNRRGSEATSEGENSHTPGERSHSSFPWGYFYDQPDSSAGVFENPVNLPSSSAAELAEVISLSRQPPMASHPPPPHTRSSPTSAIRYTGNPSRSSHRSSLRLNLPPPQVLDMFGVAVQSGLLDRRTDSEGHGAGGGINDQQRLGRSLLGIAFPATPGTGLNSMPVLRAGNGRDGRGLDSTGAGMATGHEIMVGGATAALLAANPHLAPGGLALLTPPDDNGVIEWRREEVLSEVVVPVSVQAVRPQSICESFSNVSSESVSNDYDISRKRVGGLRKLDLNAIASSARVNQSEAAEAEEKGSATKRDAVSEKGDSMIDKPAKGYKDGPGFPGFAEDGWLGSAMTTLFDSPLFVQITSDAVRMLSYSLPCPLPSTNATDQSTVTSTSTNSNMLPASAASAPAVAAAAGQPFSPALAARCHSRVREHSGSSTPTGLIGADDGVTTALHTLTHGIQRRYSNDESKRIYIHVSHAISPHIPLNRLPSTPSMACGGLGNNFGGSFNDPSAGGAGGYFSPSVFNSIVVAPGSSTSTPGAGILSVSTSSPNPILPPCSLHLTLLERYIPPTSRQEDEDMFSPTSSIFLDRLLELSPNGGSLLFIYPTKTGARDFDKQYLGPILDPLLRKLMVLYMLREDLLWGIRNMAAIDGMKEFDGLKWELQKICRKLSSRGSAGQGDSNRFPGRSNTIFKLVHASKENIPLNDNSWREWWTQQEQFRIREAVKKHFSNLQPPGERNSPTTPVSPKSKSPKKASSRAPPSMSQSAKLPPSSPTSGTFDTTPTTSSVAYSFGYGAPGDLAREVLDGVRAPTVRPSSRGMSEAVVASAMSGTTSLGVGGVVGDLDATGDRSFGRRRVRERGVEVGVFVLRREYGN